MNCPVCKTVTLVMADRQGIEVDYCPQCRGIWLDRGELDKLIERAAAATGMPEREASPPRDPGAGAYRERRDYDDDHRWKKKKRGFLGDLFDFD
jgi:uncharacterized protein